MAYKLKKGKMYKFKSPFTDLEIQGTYLGDSKAKDSYMTKVAEFRVFGVPNDKIIGIPKNAQSIKELK